MEDVRIIYVRAQENENEVVNDVFVYGFAHDWQTLISAVCKVQEKSVYPVKIEKFNDIFVISTNFVEVIQKRAVIDEEN